MNCTSIKYLPIYNTHLFLVSWTGQNIFKAFYRLPTCSETWFYPFFLWKRSLFFDSNRCLRKNELTGKCVFNANFQYRAYYHFLILGTHSSSLYSGSLCCGVLPAVGGGIGNYHSLAFKHFVDCLSSWLLFQHGIHGSSVMSTNSSYASSISSFSALIMVWYKSST